MLLLLYTRIVVHQLSYMYLLKWYFSYYSTFSGLSFQIYHLKMNASNLLMVVITIIYFSLGFTFEEIKMFCSVRMKRSAVFSFSE